MFFQLCVLVQNAVPRQIQNMDQANRLIGREWPMFVYFSKYGCPSCDKTGKMFSSVAADIKYAGFVTVDCMTYEVSQLCHENHVQTYPTFMFFPKNNKTGVLYTGMRYRDGLQDFVERSLNLPISRPIRPVFEPSSDSIDRFIASEQAVFVAYLNSAEQFSKMFFVEVEEAAKTLKDDGIKFVIVNCLDKGEYCDKNGISALPSARLYRNGVFSEFSGGLTELDIVEFIKKSNFGEL